MSQIADLNQDFKAHSTRNPSLSISTVLRLLLYIIYATLPFFKTPMIATDTKITAIIYTIDADTYVSTEIVLQTLLVLLRILEYYRDIQHKTLYHKNRLKVLIGITLIIVVADFAIPQYILDILLRPIFLVAYYRKSFEMLKIYIQIARYNWRYYIIMALSLILFSALGYMLFNQYQLSNGDNMFDSFSQLLFSLILLQSTSNFPDIALPYYEVNKLSILFFVLFLLVNWTVIYNIIMSSSFQIYSSMVEEEYLDETMQLEEYQLLEKQKQQSYTKLVLAFEERGLIRTILPIVRHPYFRVFKWLTNVLLFFVVCYHPIGVYPQNILILMLVVTLILGLQSILRIVVYFSQQSYTLVVSYLFRNGKFLMYDVVATIFIIVTTVIILIEGNRQYKFYPYLIILRLPFVINPIIYAVFYKFFKNQPNQEGTENISNFALTHQFLPKFFMVLYMLIMVMISFSALGQLLFDGVITQQKIELLVANNINPKYIYLNFNSTLSSFFTLFSLLVVNNWNFIVKMYVLVTKNHWMQVYFGIYFLIAVVICYYILIATIIEYIFTVSKKKTELNQLIQSNTINLHQTQIIR